MARWLVRVHMESGDSFLRVCTGPELSDSISGVLSALRERTSEDKAERITVQPYLFKCTATAKDIYVTNIAGKITHCMQDGQVLRPEVSPYLNRICNAFGRFQCLYSPQCNLYMTPCWRFTFFRGGTNYEAVSEVFEHAFGAQCLAKVEVHVVVLSWNIARPVRVCNQTLTDAIGSFGVWTTGVPMLEENSHNVTYTLTCQAEGMAAADVRSHMLAAAQKRGCDVEAVVDEAVVGLRNTKHMLLSVTHTGAVNLFVTVQDDYKWEPGMERKCFGLARMLKQVIEKNT